MRITCTIPTATSPINGHEFEGEPGALVSVNDIPDDEAELLLTIPGYIEYGVDPEAPAGDLAALRAELTALGVEPKAAWKAARLNAEIAKAIAAQAAS